MDIHWGYLYLAVETILKAVGWLVRLRNEGEWVGGKNAHNECCGSISCAPSETAVSNDRYVCRGEVDEVVVQLELPD